MLLINIWIFIPLLVYRWGVEGVTTHKIEEGTSYFIPFAKVPNEIFPPKLFQYAPL